MGNVVQRESRIACGGRAEVLAVCVWEAGRVGAQGVFMCNLVKPDFLSSSDQDFGGRIAEQLY